jgi:hypothetical protein
MAEDEHKKNKVVVNTSQEVVAVAMICQSVNLHHRFVLRTQCKTQKLPSTPVSKHRSQTTLRLALAESLSSTLD